MSYYRSRSTMTKEPSGLYVRKTDGVVEGTDELPKMANMDSESSQPMVSFNIPTLIRVMELAREDVVSDDILHFLVEKIIEVGANCDVIDMNDFEEIASVVPARVMASQRRLRDGRRA